MQTPSPKTRLDALDAALVAVLAVVMLVTVAVTVSGRDRAAAEGETLIAVSAR